MMNIPVSYTGIIVAAIAQMILGFIWYGPLFGKAWQKMRGFSSKSPAEMKEMQKQMIPYYGVTFVLALITAYILSHVMFFSQNYFHYSRLATGLTTGLSVWIGFMLPLHVGATIFSEKKDWKLFGVEAGYWLVGILVMGLVIGYF